MQEGSVQEAHVHAPPEGFLRRYVFSLDHKVIGKQYYALALVAVFTGMLLSWLMRIHMVWPNAKIPGLELLSKTGAPGGIMTPEYYLSLLTMHGTLMVFFVLTNAPFAAFGNYFLPIQIGAEDMAFPRFNMMSFWTTFAAWVVLMLAFFIPDGPPIAGWTEYTPLSAVGRDAGAARGGGAARAPTRGGQGRGPRHGGGREPVGSLNRNFLCGVAPGCAELHRHHSRFAGQGHDAHAHAAVHLGVVRYFLYRTAGVRRALSGLHPAYPGPSCGNQF